MNMQTKRLILRPWRETDFEPFARLNADPVAMEFFPSKLTRQESDDLAKRFANEIDERGWGFWAVGAAGISDFIGMIGISNPKWEAHFTPAVEVGWRLLPEFWGRGYAVEGAKAALQFGFESLGLEEIVALTAVANTRSRRVMEKLGMRRHARDDFDHPKVAVGHPLRRHVLYRITKRELRLMLQ